MSKCALCGGEVVRRYKVVWSNVKWKHITIVVYRCVKCGKEG